MAKIEGTVGIVGGTGMLGSALALGMLREGALPGERLWLCNRSGRAPQDPALGGATVTTQIEDLEAACDIVILSLPPDRAADLRLGGAGLVVSVMAGVDLAALARIAGHGRVVRAMSSPAAARGMAFSPWVSAAPLDGSDRARVTSVLGACGTTDELPDEGLIDVFTAMTGPVPGFVAYVAEAMGDWAVARGVPPGTADAAVRQLFLGAGEMMARTSATPAEHVQQMVDYAGTTAAGLETLRRGPLAAALAEGLDAAVARARTIGR